MSRDHIYHCEGPDCEVHVQSTGDAPVAGWLLVTNHWPNAGMVEHDFCGWNCLMLYAAQYDPPTVIEVGPDGGMGN